MAKDLEKWIHTSDGNIFIPKMRPQDIYISDASDTKPLIQISNAGTKDAEISINSIPLSDDPVIYIGTNNGNKKVKLIYYGTGEINKLIWSAN